MSERETVLVVLSGGQDSTTCLMHVLHMGYLVHAVTFDYGQTHAIEIAAAKKVMEIAGEFYPGQCLTHEVIQVPGILKSTSPLLDRTQVLEKYENAVQMEEVIGDRREKTFVPMRNALFITIAANRAEVLGAKAIMLGICQEDNANYDDCRELFRAHAEDYVNTALGHDHRGTEPIVIIAPLMHLSKSETVLLAYKTPGAFKALSYSHTSYDGCYPPTDMNHANVLRAKGFEDAGLPDPLVLRAHHEGLMELPSTANYDACR